MARRDPKAISKALKELTLFLSEFGDSEHTRNVRFREFIRFEEERFTTELLAEMQNFKDEVFIQVREQIWAHRRLLDKDEEQTTVEFERVFGNLGQAIYPADPEPPEMNITGFAGAERVERKTLSYGGDSAKVRPIVERSLALVQRYCEAVGRGDFQAAYAMTGEGLRTWMSFKRFVTAHEQAARKYGGPAIEFQIDGFQFVFADDTARKKSSAEEAWPKSTPKEVRRSTLIGFWVRDLAAQTGCWGAFWITEENREYRVARFEFYTQ